MLERANNFSEIHLILLFLPIGKLNSEIFQPLRADRTQMQTLTDN